MLLLRLQSEYEIMLKLVGVYYLFEEGVEVRFGENS